MERIPVANSSSVRSVWHDEQTGMLHVEYQTGAVYQYSGVTPGIFQNMMQAPSIGNFLRTQVKSRPDLFPFTKLKSIQDSTL